jgi:hypothetical protein
LKAIKDLLGIRWLKALRVLSIHVTFKDSRAFKSWKGFKVLRGVKGLRRIQRCRGCVGLYGVFGAGSSVRFKAMHETLSSL